MATRLFLDIDCTIADFVSGAARLHGVDLDAMMAYWPPGEYGMEHQLARHLGWVGAPEGDGKVSFSGPFWEKINGTPGFWYGLDKLPWADELVAFSRTLTNDLWFVTAPSRCAGCVREKEDWLAKHFGVPHDRMIATPHKFLLANSFSVLIDDHDKNCDSFERAGGVSIVVPSHHNRLFREASDPFGYIKSRLQCTLENHRA